MSGCEPIEAYLDALLLELRGSPRAARHVLREVEAHLLDATNEGVDEGLTEDEAARRAVERFGPPALVARQLARASGSVGLVTLVRDAVVSLLPVGAVFLVAIGLSGLVAGGLGLAVGKDFVAGDPPGVTYTAERCAQLLSFEPGAEGVLGIVLLAAWAVWRRRSRDRLRAGTLGRSFSLTVGATLAAAAAAGLLFLAAAGPVTGHYDGTGNPLSGGLVSALLGVAFGVALWRELRARRIVDA